MEVGGWRLGEEVVEEDEMRGEFGTEDVGEREEKEDEDDGDPLVERLGCGGVRLEEPLDFLLPLLPQRSLPRLLHAPVRVVPHSPPRPLRDLHRRSRRCISATIPRQNRSHMRVLVDRRSSRRRSRRCGRRCGGGRLW